MVDVKLFFEEIKDLGIDFFTGVPDSLLKDICAYITSNSRPIIESLSPSLSLLLIKFILLVGP